MAPFTTEVANSTWTCTQSNNFAPNEYRGVVNSSGLVVYKGSNTRDKRGTSKSKNLKVNCGCEQWCGDWTEVT